jgi:hypothetical protein
MDGRDGALDETLKAGMQIDKRYSSAANSARRAPLQE